MKIPAAIALCIGSACLCIRAQEPDYGISVPVTISGNALFDRGLQGDDPHKISTTAGLRAVVSPSLRLGPHWFLYSSFEVHSSSYFHYQSGLDTDSPIYFHAMQAFLGYTTTIGKATILIKAGQLSSAFGYFPLEYDEAKTSFPNLPPAYGTPVPLRPDQLPCGVIDLLSQTYGQDLDYRCGGSQADSYGTLPVALYGLPGIEAELSAGHIDARLQVTNSSPANPHGFLSESQFVQWTAGGGYSFRGGLRIGVSGFRGPYLDRLLEPLLPPGKTLRDFPASGIGTDVQWARGRWSTEGEWQQFRFDLPGFVTSPSERTAYAEVKSILSPRAFLAVRATTLNFGRVQDASGLAVNTFASPEQVYEFGFGYRPDRRQLIKVEYEWAKLGAWSANSRFWPGRRGSGLEIQLVTAFTPFSRAFR